MLLPARTSLPVLEDALDAAGIPYRAEASSLVYQAAEVRDLLAAARAVADPTDELRAGHRAALAAVRLRRRRPVDAGSTAAARSTSSAPMPEARSPTTRSADGARLPARGCTTEVRWLTPRELLDRDRRRPPDARGRGHRSREPATCGGGCGSSSTRPGPGPRPSTAGCGAYLAWAAHQGEEGARVAEAVLPETDDDAVRMMTIHAAKGLEFPMVILSGLTASRRTGAACRCSGPPTAATRSSSVAAHPDQRLRGRSSRSTSRWTPRRRRLLYVACTRARDHLVVSLHRPERPLGPAVGGADRSLAPADYGAGARRAPTLRVGRRSEVTRAERRRRRPTGTPGRPQVDRGPGRRPVATAADQRLRPGGHRPGGRARTGRRADAGLAKGARDLELPPWSKGRYGTAIGRAVHAVLQTVDLHTGAGLDGAVAAACLAEGVIEHDRRSSPPRPVGARLRRRAARCRPTALARVLAGTVEAGRHGPRGLRRPDLPRGRRPLVIVDYKTDAIPASAIPARAMHYAGQIRAYQQMLDDAASAASSGRLLFLHPTTSYEAQP